MQWREQKIWEIAMKEKKKASDNGVYIVLAISGLKSLLNK